MDDKRITFMLCISRMYQKPTFLVGKYAYNIVVFSTWNLTQTDYRTCAHVSSTHNRVFIEPAPCQPRCRRILSGAGRRCGVTFVSSSAPGLSAGQSALAGRSGQLLTASVSKTRLMAGRAGGGGFISGRQPREVNNLICCSAALGSRSRPTGVI